jgi:hypothetical protein
MPPTTFPFDAASRSRASRRNNILPLSRPRIERAVDCDGFYVLRGDHGWLVGSRSQALEEHRALVEIERGIQREVAS